MKKILIFFLMLFQLKAADFQWSFPPETLSTSAVNASDPQIALDLNGNSFAIWVENGSVKAKIKLMSMDWGSVFALSNSGSSAPRIISDSNGNVTAVWIENGIVKACAKSLNGNWTSPVSLSNSGSSSPMLAVGTVGDVVAVWVRNGNIESSLKLFGANWQNRVSINSTGASSPCVAIAGTGANKRAVVVWHSVSSSPNVVYVSTRLLSGNWANPLAISNPNTNAAFAQVALDANANATAIWYRYNFSDSNYSKVVVQSASRLPNGDWTDPVDISDSGIRNPATLCSRISYDKNGNAIAVWNTSYDDETFTIQSSIKPVRENWTPVSDLVKENLFAYQSDLAVSAWGDALVVYMFYNGVDKLIQSSGSDITGFMNEVWSVPLNLSQGTNNCCPRVATATQGDSIRAAAVWLSSNGLNTSVLAAIANKPLVLPPSGLSVVQTAHNYGVFTEYSNTIDWIASSDPSVVGYLVYRNGVFIEEVAANSLQFVDDNRVQNGPVTYGVAAVDRQNAHSQIVSVSFP